MSESYWVVEHFVEGNGAGYWDGGSSRSFVPDIQQAVQFRRKQDAFWATKGWHWKDVQITEHIDIESSRPGYAWVPVEPTEGMIAAAQPAMMDHAPYEDWLADNRYEVVAIYKAMLEASKEGGE